MVTTEIEKKNIVFFHPDLGIGGAERLVIDSAVGLQKRGHRVVIFTSRCHRYHCFDEVRDGTLDVRVRGDAIVPPSILSRFSIMCAILRQINLILSIYCSSELSKLKPDVFFVDQLSAGLPWLTYLYPQTKVLFYCHFPDLLLAQGRNAWWKRVYRIPFDLIEEWSLTFADSIVVNSEFTKKIVKSVFQDLTKTKDLQVIHPCVNIKDVIHENNKVSSPLGGKKHLLLSINRFERKKDIALAIRAFAGLEKQEDQDVRLVLAGGYDNHVQENVIYHKELVDLAKSLGLKTATTKTILTALKVPDEIDVLFLLSVTDTLKDMLLKAARLLIYTPSNEHFGIVPLEAMLAGVPVLAANTGGPLESVIDGETGWLCPPDNIERWTTVIHNVMYNLSDGDLRKIGNCCTERVKQEFSNDKMTEKLESAIFSMNTTTRRSSQVLSFFLLGIFVFIFDSAYFVISHYRNHSKWSKKIQFKPFTLTCLAIATWIGYLLMAYSRKMRRK